MAVFHQVAVPPQHRVRADQQPKPAQRRAGQRHEQCRQKYPIFGPELHALASELPLHDGELVTQSENLDVLLTVGHRQQPQRGESMLDGKVGEADQHEPPSCLTMTGPVPMPVDLRGRISRHVQALGTPCAHENACVRCPLLRVDPAQMPRLEEIRTNLVARLQEAKDQGWLGEVAAIETTMAAATQKLEAMQALATQHNRPPRDAQFRSRGWQVEFQRLILWPSAHAEEGVGWGPVGRVLSTVSGSKAGR
jgi:hypothetical protein